MSIKSFKTNIAALAVSGLLLCVLTAVAPCFAGGAVTIVIDKNQLAPKGSNIPDRRVKAVLKKIEERKAIMEKKALQQQEHQQENKTSDP